MSSKGLPSSNAVSVTAVRKSTDPLVLLRAMEQQAESLDAQLPSQDDAVGYWGGVAFRLLGVDLLISTESLVEVVTMQPTTRVPGSKPWVKGLANIRGNLIPVFDLRELLGGEPAAASRRVGMLILRSGHEQLGMLVDEVFGIRRFPVDQKVSGVARGLPDALSPFTRSKLSSADSEIAVLDSQALLESPLLQDVAA